MKKRVEKTVLNFKTKKSNEKMTARSGLLLFVEAFFAMNLDEALAKKISKPKSGRGFQTKDFALPLMMMLYGGGESISDTREIREDEALREAGNIDIVPSDSAFGDWIRRIGKRKGIAGFEKVNDDLVQKMLHKSESKSVTLVVDPSFIKAEKHDAKMTYEGYRGYRPVYAVILELGLIANYKFKHGNDNGGRFSFVKKSIEKIEKTTNVGLFLADSEYYVADIFNPCNYKNINFAVAAHIDSSSSKAINEIKEEQWKQFEDKHGVTVQGVEVAETVHAMDSTKEAFRFVVKRWYNKYNELRFHAVATNINSGTTQDIFLKYDNRANAENVIKENKNGFGMFKMPSGSFAGNAIFFAIGVLCYNLFIAQKLYTMPCAYGKKTIKSIRWLLLELPAKLVKIACGWVVLEIATHAKKYKMFCEVRRRNHELFQFFNSG